jgi:hypothetical protein
MGVGPAAGLSSPLLSRRAGEAVHPQRQHGDRMMLVGDAAHPVGAGQGAARIRSLAMPVTFNRSCEKATGWLYAHDPGRLPAATRDLS